MNWISLAVGAAGIAMVIAAFPIMGGNAVSNERRLPAAFGMLIVGCLMTLGSIIYFIVQAFR